MKFPLPADKLFLLSYSKLWTINVYFDLGFLGGIKLISHCLSCLPGQSLRTTLTSSTLSWVPPYPLYPRSALTQGFFADHALPNLQAPQTTAVP